MPPAASFQVLKLPASSSWSDFFRGLVLPFHATRLLFGHRKLFLFSALASVVTFFSLVGVVWVLVAHTAGWVGYFWPQPEAWYAVALWYLVVILTFLLLLLVGANTVPVLLLAPLQDPISEATEEAYGDFAALPFSLSALGKNVATSVFHTLGRIAVLLGGHALLLPLHLVPGWGSVLWTVAATTWSIFWVAAEFLSGVMARHNYTFQQVVNALRGRSRLALGFGTAVYLLLWVPVLNLFFVPLAIIAATQLFRALRAVGHIPPPPGAG